MKPFRVVKPRKDNVETEQDLRGLSEENFFKHSSPLSVLTVHCDQQTSAQITQVLENSYPSLEWFADSTALHISGRTEHNEQFKQDLIELYVLSLTLAESLPSSVKISMNLWVLNQMRVHMERSIDGQPALDTQEVIELHHPKTTNFLSVSQCCLPYLRQAGFREVQNSNIDWNLSQSEAATLLAKERVTSESSTGISHSKKAI